MWVSQYEGSFIEDVGMLKMDFLGLRTLSIIKEALSNIKKHMGIEIDIDHIPLDDKKTYALFCKGDTIATFQFESPGMQKWLRELKPSKIEDLIAMNALYRPGPMDYIPDFVDRKLFPYLHGFKQRAAGPDTIEYKIGEIFGEIKNKIRSGYTLRDIIDHVDELRFGSQVEKHELSALYEEKIKRMGNAGRNGGEYYTPRPLIRAMIQVTAPKIGERIYDGACGSAGFLCEAHDFLRAKIGRASCRERVYALV